ncbi:MAG: glutaredoxin domain-containing protein [Candidatus Peregrinibacteria bacterium]
MKKFLLSVFSVLLFVSYFSVGVFASGNDLELLFFYGGGCPHCAKAKVFLEEMKNKYPTLDVEEYEVYFNQENREYFDEVAQAFDTEITGVPVIFVDGKVFKGFSDVLAYTLEQEIKKCVEEGCESAEITEIVGGSSLLESPSREDLRKKLTIPAVLSAAAVDAINPCAFAVLIILLTTILATKSKQRALLAGLAFSLSIFVSYFLMGLGLYSAIQAAEFTHVFYIIVSILAILVGLFNLKDYFWYGKWFIMEVPMSWRPKLKGLIRGVTSVPGAFLIGFVVSLFLLPCTSGPYIVILGLLASATERGYAMLILLLYNFVFVLPMLLITGAIYFGFTTTEKAEEWRQGKLKVLHLIAGLIILLLGVGMLVALWLGYI